MANPENKTYTLIGADGNSYRILSGQRADKIYGTLDCKGAARWTAKGHYIKQRVFWPTKRRQSQQFIALVLDASVTNIESGGPNNNMLYKEWIDFVSFPLDPYKCRSREQRIDLSEAITVDSANYTAELGTEKGVIVPKETIFFDGDKFEAIEIADYGGVTIWTDKKVWFLHRDRGLEKLFFVHRHPNPEDYAYLNKSK